MPRYLQAESVACLTNARGKEFTKVIEELGLSPERAHRLQRVWILRIHGRCVRCESEKGTKCSCSEGSTRVDDNRRPVTVLERLSTDTVLTTAPCRMCKESVPYRVRDALRRIKRRDDWSAFFRCEPCFAASKAKAKKKLKAKRQRLKAREKESVEKSTPKPAKKRASKQKAGKQKALKPRTAPRSRRPQWFNKPFMTLFEEQGMGNVGAGNR